MKYFIAVLIICSTLTIGSIPGQAASSSALISSEVMHSFDLDQYLGEGHQFNILNNLFKQPGQHNYRAINYSVSKRNIGGKKYIDIVF